MEVRLILHRGRGTPSFTTAFVPHGQVALHLIQIRQCNITSVVDTEQRITPSCCISRSQKVQKLNIAKNQGGDLSEWLMSTGHEGL